jgi:hypothetical protein
MAGEIPAATPLLGRSPVDIDDDRYVIATGGTFPRDPLVVDADLDVLYTLDARAVHEDVVDVLRIIIAVSPVVGWSGRAE